MSKHITEVEKEEKGGKKRIWKGEKHILDLEPFQTRLRMGSSMCLIMCVKLKSEKVLCFYSHNYMSFNFSPLDDSVYQ